MRRKSRRCALCARQSMPKSKHPCLDAVGAVQSMNFKIFPLKFHIITLVVGMLVITSVTLTWLSNRTLTVQMLTAGEDLFDRITSTTAEGLETELKPARVAAQVLANSPVTAIAGLNERLKFTASLLAATKSRDSFTSAYIATRAGSFLQVRHLEDDAARKLLDAPFDAHYMARSIDRDKPGRIDAVRYFYTEDQALIEARAVKDEYDPRTRAWYSAAEAADAGAEILTTPYVFASTGEVGITVAVRHPQGVAVVGVDITLKSLSRLLSDFRKKKGVDLVLFDAQGQVIAHPDPAMSAGTATQSGVRLKHLNELNDPRMSAMWTQFSQASGPVVKRMAGKTLSTVAVEGRDYFLRTDKVLGYDQVAFFLGAMTPVDELIAPAIAARNRAMWITLAAVLVMVGVSVMVARGVSRPISELTHEAQKIARFQFDVQPRAASRVREVHELGLMIDSMRHTIRRFLEISTALGAEGNFDRLLARILQETVSTAGAKGGAVLLLSADATELVGGAFMIPSAPGLQFADVRQHARLDDAPVLASCIRERKTVAHRLHKDAQGTNPRETVVLELLREKACDTVFLPLIDRSGGVLGVLAMYWPDKADGSAATDDDQRLAFVQALSGTASVALANQQLIAQQKQLLQSFIELIAGAIDAKSPYTGGHCQRVPELTKMLAKAAQAQTEGVFADFKLNDDEWEELHIAAWLHDCGKVTTPEFVVDKSTKLETVYDRIHEVRMRFELVKAQAENDTLRQALEAVRDGRDPQPLFDALAARLHALDDDWAFVATCNVGGEFMAPDKVERLKAIAQTTWLRTLDDRMGVSHDELLRKQLQPAVPLPVRELLLQDRPEHIFERTERERRSPDAAPGNPWGFALNTPDVLYNRGELYNLSISRGTLTAEDRYKINDHIVQTIKMLATLPFPKHLQRVPEIAGGHHEKMDGTGYPKRLTREQMSWPARMMAIADIFEALTAVDRPYKKGKMLSEAIKIMGFMVRDQHIDVDLFALFLRSGVYLEYAKRFMKPEQIDGVYVEAVLQPLFLPT